MISLPMRDQKVISMSDEEVARIVSLPIYCASPMLTLWNLIYTLNASLIYTVKIHPILISIFHGKIETTLRAIFFNAIQMLLCFVPTTPSSIGRLFVNLGKYLVYQNQTLTFLVAGNLTTVNSISYHNSY